MNKLISKVLTIGTIVMSLSIALPALAAGVTVGNAVTNRSNLDSYTNFTIIDTNNPVSANGTLGVFSYYAANTNPFEFVLVNSGNTVQWISPTITPSVVGVNTWNSPTAVNVQAEWNLGVHFDSTSTIPFDFVGAPAPYTPNNNGMPIVSATLSIEGTSTRTYSIDAASPEVVSLATSTVTTVIRDSSNNATTSVSAGSLVYDSATVAAVLPATSTPTGAVNFSLFSNTTCAGTSTVQSTVSLLNGSATSSSVIASSTGLSYLANYNGDAVYAPIVGTCELLTVTTPVVTGTTTATTTPTGAGSISGTVYNDLNINGIKDFTEPGLGGWTINLYNAPGWSGPTNRAPFMTTVSDVNGNYSFTNLAAGIYSIEEINQPTLHQFTADFSPVVVASSSVLVNMNFGNIAGNPTQPAKPVIVTATSTGTGGSGDKGNQGGQGNGQHSNGQGNGNSHGDSGNRSGRGK